MGTPVDTDNVHNPFCTKLLASGTIYDPVFACLSPKSLIRLALTCRSTREAITRFKSRAYNINNHFSRYFSNPIAFRSLQARTNTLVSGSNVLQFLDRTFYPESDLDIYTHPGHSFEVATFLVVNEGYLFVPSESQEQNWQDAVPDNWDGTQTRVVLEEDTGRAYTMKSIHAVWAFKKTGPNGERLAVQVIESSSSPIESILGFHSSCVMNFITAEAAYSLYPMATFEARCAMACRADNHAIDAVEKYVNRGWRVYARPLPKHRSNSTKSLFFLSEERWVGDKNTWALPLDGTGVGGRVPLSPTSALLTFDPTLFNGWRLHPRHGREINGWECQYYPLHTTVFRYNYAIPNEGLQQRIRYWAGGQGRFSHDELTIQSWMWFDQDLTDFVTN